MIDLRAPVSYLNPEQFTEGGAVFALFQPTIVSPLKDLLSSDDPLSPDAIRRLIEHREEDDLVEYKSQWNLDNLRETLEITKDVIAFANTHGGFIVFGFEDRSFGFIGLAEESVNTLTDINRISQQLSRFVKPSFGALRSRRFESGGLLGVILFIPESIDRTHIVVSDGAFKGSDGSPVVILRPGMTFTRSCGRNQHLTPEGLDLIVGKRLTAWGRSLLDNIVKVVEAPPDHVVNIVPTFAGGAMPVRVTTDDPSALKIQGLPVTKPPESDEEEIAGWVALSVPGSGMRPSKEDIWKKYARRHDLKLGRQQLEYMGRYALLYDAAPLFWLRHLSAEEIEHLLVDLSGHETSHFVHNTIARTATFTNSRIHARALSAMRIRKRNLDESYQRYPRGGGLRLLSPAIITSYRPQKMSNNDGKLREILETKLSEYAALFGAGDGGEFEKEHARVFDAYLYGPSVLKICRDTAASQGARHGGQGLLEVPPGRVDGTNVERRSVAPLTYPD